MDAQAHTDFYQALVNQGFQGDEEALRQCIEKAEQDTAERCAISFWTLCGTRPQALLVSRAFAHAHKHGMTTLFSLSRPKEFKLFSRPLDPAIRLNYLELTGDKARLVFTKNGKHVGERMLRQQKPATTH